MTLCDIVHQNTMTAEKIVVVQLMLPPLRMDTNAIILGCSLDHFHHGINSANFHYPEFIYWYMLAFTLY